MKRVFLTIVAGLILSVAVVAQNVSGSSQNSGAFVLESGAVLEGQLQSTLDVKKAKVGDSIVLKTTKALKHNDETVVPKGSKLLGRVTEVQPRTKLDNISRVGLIFDRLQGRDLSSRITASIISITKVEPANLASVSDADLFASSAAAPRPSGSAQARGGLLGGSVPAVGGIGGVGNILGSTLGSGTAVVGSITNTAAGTLGSSTGAVVKTVDGIQITQSIAGSAHATATLEAAGRDIRLEKGTAMQVQVASAPPKEE